MATSEEWRVVVARIRLAGTALRSPDLADLYELAVHDGEAILARRYGDVRSDERRDLVHDVLIKALDEIVAADNPRGYFLVCLRNHVTSQLRLEMTRRTEVDEERALAEADARPAQGDARIELGELLALLDDAPPRDVQVLLAAALGERDGDALAEAFGISRANVHQIISRLRKHLRAVTGRSS